MSIEVENELKRQCEAWIEDLEKIAEGKITPEEFIENNALEIKRIQSFNGGEWETVDYIIVVTVGGPYVEINGYERAVIGYWTPEEVKERFTLKAKDGYEMIFEYLNEIGEWKWNG